jgi:hypothetical protein
MRPTLTSTEFLAPAAPASPTVIVSATDEPTDVASPTDAPTTPATETPFPPTETPTITPSPTPVPAVAALFIYEDTNGNGHCDLGETGVPGEPVRVDTVAYQSDGEGQVLLGRYPPGTVLGVQYAGQRRLTSAGSIQITTGENADCGFGLAPVISSAPAIGLSWPLVGLGAVIIGILVVGSVWAIRQG